MSCKQGVLAGSVIPSDTVYDFLVSGEENETERADLLCVQEISPEYSVYYYDASRLPALSVGEYSYTSIPKCFHLMDQTALDASTIPAVQNQPGLALKGDGVLIGFADTGIDYTNPLFLDENGNSRIVSIWDQTIEALDEGTSAPDGFLYGTEYKKEQIDRALRARNPFEEVPTRDENGHGTFLAGVAAGSVNPEMDFSGVAPLSNLIVVKLKAAKSYLRDFFYLPEEEVIYQENDIMAAVSYMDRVAREQNRPLVIVLGIGSNQGSHVGAEPLALFLDEIGAASGRAVVVASGNEGAAQHHFLGVADNVLRPEEAELNVSENVAGFCMELWAYAPELVRVVLQSPTGQRSRLDFPISGDTQKIDYVFENTKVTINYRIAGRTRGDLLVFFRFQAPAPGIWTVLVYPENVVSGNFHIWLPIQTAGEDGRRGTVTFVQPEPDTTLTSPSALRLGITVGGYQQLSDSVYVLSGRGFDALGRVKPAFVAPAVSVEGPDLRGNPVRRSGTSVAAAIAGGAAALTLEWGVVRLNAPGMNSVQVQNFLIRGCRRNEERIYPNTEWGYGQLDLYQSFLRLRE